jgi:hypothetical protein
MSGHTSRVCGRRACLRALAGMALALAAAMTTVLVVVGSSRAAVAPTVRSLHPDFHARLGMTLQLSASGDPTDRIKVILTGPNGAQTIYSSGQTLPSAVVEVPWNMRALKAGSYTLATQLVDASGTARAEQKESFSRDYDGWAVAGSTNKGPVTGFDENNGIFVDGKPFFGVFDWLTGGGCDPRGPAWCLDSKGPLGAGVLNGNVGNAYFENPAGGEYTTPGNWATMLSRCQAAQVRCSGPVRNLYAHDLIQQPEPFFKAYIDASKQAPAFHMYQWNEEPEIQDYGLSGNSLDQNAGKAAEVRRWTDISHRYDSQHPVRMNFVGRFWGGGSDYEVLVERQYSSDLLDAGKPLVADLYANDYYPVQLWTDHLANPAALPWVTSKQMTFDVIPKTMANLRSWTRDLVPLSAYVEVANINPSSAQPTATEVWGEAWQYIVAGAKELNWFRFFGGIHDGVELRMKQVVDTTRQYAGALEGADSGAISRTTNSGSGRVRYLTKTDPSIPNKLFVFTVNEDINDTASVTYSVSGCSITAAKSIDAYDGSSAQNSRPLAVSGGTSVTDTYGASGVHIYELDTTGTCDNTRSTTPPPPPGDTTPPDTTVTSGPESVTTSTTASLAFTSTESGSSFECKLDSGSWHACTSPNSETGLSTGSHSEAVRATDGAGNVDPTPATWTWSVVAPPPPPAPAPPPPPAPAPLGLLFGNPALESHVEYNPRGEAQAYRFVAGAGGSLRSIRTYIDGANEATSMTIGVYTNASNGHPKSLLSKARLTPVKGAWNRLTMPTARIATGTSYWVAVLGTSSGSIRYRTRANAGMSETDSRQLTALPATWRTGKQYPFARPSIWAGTG